MYISPEGCIEDQIEQVALVTLSSATGEATCDENILEDLSTQMKTSKSLSVKKDAKLSNALSTKNIFKN